MIVKRVMKRGKRNDKKPKCFLLINVGFWQMRLFSSFVSLPLKALLFGKEQYVMS
jgi:hypothetical protein